MPFSFFHAAVIHEKPVLRRSCAKEDDQPAVSLRLSRIYWMNERSGTRRYAGDDQDIFALGTCRKGRAERAQDAESVAMFIA
jgi:hypothetical protein